MCEEGLRWKELALDWRQGNLWDLHESPSINCWVGAFTAPQREGWRQENRTSI
jgi:hypothetical protein